MFENWEKFLNDVLKDEKPKPKGSEKDIEDKMQLQSAKNVQE